jgi:hypothetical protein
VIRPRPGDVLAGVAGAGLIASLFAHWYGTSTGWSAFTVTDIVLVVLALPGIGLLVATLARRSPVLPVAFGVIGTVTGILATLVVLWRLVDQPGSAGVSGGAWLGLAAALALAVGCGLSLGDETNRGQEMPPVELRPTPPAHLES